MENEKTKLTANFTEEEFEKLKRLADREQRTPTDMVRVLYRNIASGKIQVPVQEKTQTQRKNLPVTVTKADTRLFEEYESTHDMSVHKATKMLINAVPENFTLQTLNNEASTDDITERLIQQQIEAARKSVPVTQEEREAAMRALMGKRSLK